MISDRSFVVGAGLARVEPTADELGAGVYLGGYGAFRSRRAETTLDAPCARAMYIGLGDRAVLFLALDLVGLDAGSVRTLRRRVAAATSVAADAVLVSCTHSHASPDTQGLWGGVPASYLRRLLNSALDAARSAHVRARPATLRAGSTVVEGLTRNRRGWADVDTALVALQALDAGGNVVATLVNFACHPTTLTAEHRDVSRDFPGALTDRLDAELGGVTLYVNGAQGDVNPARSGGAEAMRALGEALAERAVRALNDAQPVGEGLFLAARRPLIPVAPERLPRWARSALRPATPALRSLATSGALSKLAAFLADRGRADTAQIVAGFAATLPGALASSRGTAVQTAVTAVAFGREAMGVTVPGEATTHLAMPVKGDLPTPHRLVLGLTHDTLGYFLPPQEWMAAPVAGYEESVSLGREAGPTWERAAREAALALGAR
ncbi:MAG TPA: hypothetical protein VNM43_09770 [Dehalococcoidia bacterium]|nr:hypothetical protein [Dehalococcoidia bacterium]